ncbi:MAG: proline--tRNA ligase [Candidatus Nanoarchaeia archaeon]|nr:proline--tRNA ligase [Candidatus Nanoarchaeia archaeon]
MSKEEGIKASKDEFSDWYTQAIIKADLVDYSPVSGCLIFKPYGYSIWETIRDETDKRFKKLGVKNVYFPLLIPESLLKKESTHLKGFNPEVAWVTEAGDSKLDERLAVRPTSETIMYNSYSKWIRSYRDLPLKYNQWNNVVRWEFKHPVPFLRTREFLWNEGHSAFATKEEALKEEKEILDIYTDICNNYLAVTGFISRKTESEKFAGAEFTKAIEFVLPNGKVVQGPDFHHDGQIFSKSFNIKFLNKEEKEEYVYQNTWAITTRMIGVMLAIHGDNKGIIMPPKIAPVQIVIVPILFTETKEKVIKKSNDILKSLKDLRIVLDDREEYTAGYKFNDWEIKGVPLRIEIGPKDIAKNQVVIVRRDNSKKEIVKITELKKKIPKLLDEIQNDLLNNSINKLKESMKKAKDMPELIKNINDKKVSIAEWCDNPECEDYIKTKTNGAKIIGINESIKTTGNCIYCNKKAKYTIYISKTY